MLEYICSQCNVSGEAKIFDMKVLSIIYRPKHENFQALIMIICKRCSNIVNSSFESFDAKIGKHGN